MGHIPHKVADAEHVVFESPLDEFTYGVLYDVGKAMVDLIGFRQEDPRYDVFISDYIERVYLGSEEAFCRDAVRLEERAYALSFNGSGGKANPGRSRAFAARVVAKSVYDGEHLSDLEASGSQQETALNLWQRSGFHEDSSELHWQIAGALMHEAEARAAPAAEEKREVVEAAA